MVSNLNNQSSKANLEKQSKGGKHANPDLPVPSHHDASIGGGSIFSGKSHSHTMAH